MGRRKTYYRANNGDTLRILLIIAVLALGATLNEKHPATHGQLSSTTLDGFVGQQGPTTLSRPHDPEPDVSDLERGDVAATAATTTTTTTTTEDWPSDDRLSRLLAPCLLDSAGFDEATRQQVLGDSNASELLAKMLRAWLEVPNQGVHLLYMAIQEECADFMKALLQLGPADGHSKRHLGPGGQETTVVHEAAHEGCKTCLEVLVEAGAHPDLGVLVDGRIVTPLERAVRQGHTQVVEWLLGTGRVNPARIRWRGSDVDALLIHADTPWPQPPLLAMTPEAMALAATCGSPDIVSLFLARGNFDDNAPLTLDTPADTTWLTAHQTECIERAFLCAAQSAISRRKPKGGGGTGGGIQTVLLLERYLGRGEYEPLVAHHDEDSDFMVGLAKAIVCAAAENDVAMFRLLVRVMFGIPFAPGEPFTREGEAARRRVGSAVHGRGPGSLIQRVMWSAVRQAIEHDCAELFGVMVLDYHADVRDVHPGREEVRNLLALLPTWESSEGHPAGVIAWYIRCLGRPGSLDSRGCNCRLGQLLDMVPSGF